MAKRLRDKQTDEIVAIEFSAAEMASLLGVELDDLMQWSKAIKPQRGKGAEATYRIKSEVDLNHLRKRAALLRTRMSEQAVLNVEKAGHLESYAQLAEDCPSGITAHIWRSYGLIVLLQTRYGRMVGPSELAERAGLKEEDPETGEVRYSVETAERHIRMLQARNFLTAIEGRWEHKGLPRSFQGV